MDKQDSSVCSVCVRAALDFQCYSLKLKIVNLIFLVCVL